MRSNLCFVLLFSETIEITAQLSTAMELQSQFLLYLDQRRILCDMKNHCENFLSEFSEVVYKFPPFRYYLEIDVMDLLNVLPDLGKSLLNEPLKLQGFCNRILYAVLRSISDDVIETVRMNQVTVTLRLKNVSQFMVESDAGIYKSLVCFIGQLVDVSKPHPYVYHSVWSCPEKCENEVILCRIPKVLPKCFICRSNLYENSGLRRCGEQVTVTFKVRKEVMPKRFQITDDLLPNVKLGSFYSLTAVVLKKTTEVWSMELITRLPAPVTSGIPKDIQELFDACGGIPWKFIYCLASTIGVNICPLNCYMHLKIALLLSLTSVNANVFTGSSIIHVLAVGFDTGFAGAIMEAGAKLAKTSLSLGTSNTSVTSALIGCTGGICYMPLPLHSYHQKLTSAVLSSIESGEIVHDTGRTKLGSAIWAQGMDFKNIVVHNVASVFGTVCRGDHGEHEDDIAEFLLQRAVEPCNENSEEKQAITDVAQYIDVVAGIQVELDGVAEKLLRNYFLAARKERPRGVSIGSLESLLNICMTSARLCRRSQTNIEDAIFAIWLHVSASPEPRFAPDEYLQTPADIKQLHKLFDNFKNWLNVFTSTYGY